MNAAHPLSHEERRGLAMSGGDRPTTAGRWEGLYLRLEVVVWIESTTLNVGTGIEGRHGPNSQ